jgi:transposase
MSDFNCSKVYVGMDVHKDTINVAIAESGRGAAREFGTIEHSADAVARMMRKLKRAHPDASIEYCYEAGPCGYGLARQIHGAAETCRVIAPALIPRRPGERIKTNRRDAKKLAQLDRAGELTSVRQPPEEQEALRDLSRAREDAMHDLRRCRQRLGALLLRHSRVYSGGPNWSRMHLRWLDQQSFDDPNLQLAYENYRRVLERAEQHHEELRQQLESAVKQSSLAELHQELQALRGVQSLAATILVAELGELSRFSNPKLLMAFLGLVPSEHSSGAKRRQGAITKTGNGHARRLLLESAQAYSHPARLTTTIRLRGERCSQTAREISWKAQQRLCPRFRRLSYSKPRNVVATAIARELCGFIWAIGVELEARRTRSPAIA